MKNKLRSILTTTAATLATVVMGTTSASAATLIESLFPYLPTEDNVGLNADDINLFETALPDYSNLGSNYDSIDIMFLGEVAGFKNSLELSVNGTKTSVFDKITAYNEIDSVGTYSTDYNGMGFLDVGTTWNSKTDGGITGLSQGDNLNFWLKSNVQNDGSFTYNFKMGDNARRWGQGETADRNSGMSLFKAYTLKGFEDYTIFAVEDVDYYGSDMIDHNDLVFAVKLNPAEDIPEPSTIIGLLGVGAAGLVLRRKSWTK
jgi:hypothetical protein